jgi:hypothetical protein
MGGEPRTGSGGAWELQRQLQRQLHGQPRQQPWRVAGQVAGEVTGEVAEIETGRVRDVSGQKVPQLHFHVPVSFEEHDATTTMRRQRQRYF